MEPGEKGRDGGHSSRSPWCLRRQRPLVPPSNTSDFRSGPQRLDPSSHDVVGVLKSGLKPSRHPGKGAATAGEKGVSGDRSTHVNSRSSHLGGAGSISLRLPGSRLCRGRLTGPDPLEAPGQP